MFQALLLSPSSCLDRLLKGLLQNGKYRNETVNPRYLTQVSTLSHF